MSKIHPIIEKILLNRGISEQADILEFLSEKPTRTYDPFLLKNLEAGVDFILSAIQQNKKICIYGDYDADGITSICLLLQVLSHLTENLTYYIPSRFEEGYGLNKEAIEGIKKDGVDLIITVDCGSVSFDEVEYGKSLGLDIIVTDHHNINDTPADCILINPKQKDCNYPFKHLAGCGVAFKLAQGLQRKSSLPKAVLTAVLDLVAIATIGDIVPLVDENRTLVKFGIREINKKKRPGLRQLIEKVGLDASLIKSENIAYIIVPHLNAAGRMMDAKIGVELLTSTDEMLIEVKTEQLIANNKERRRVQEETFIKCKEIVEESHKEDLFLIIDAKEAHEGIAGIVAGKIKEEYGRPAILVTPSGGEDYLKGTGRSIEGINLYDLLKNHEKLFIKFGGHAGACGFLMEKAKLEELRSCLNTELQSAFEANSELFAQNPIIDAEIDPAELTLDLASELEKLAPFGHQNQKPVLLMNAICPSSIAFLGESKQHLRFNGKGAVGGQFSCILFQKAQELGKDLQEDMVISLVGYADINTWNGSSKVQFVLKNITW